MFGKHFSSMYTGSMVGSGAIVFAVMGYVVSNMIPDKIVGMQVELNPKLLSFILGETEEDVLKAINFLCRPDPKSRSKEKEGRRLIKIAEYDYQVVNGVKYRAIKNEEERREQNRKAQAKFRNTHKPSPLEKAYEKAAMDGNEALCDELASSGIPDPPKTLAQLNQEQDKPF